jgi:hypothetical protein
MRLASNLATRRQRELDQHEPLGNRRWMLIAAAGLRQGERRPGVTASES